LHDITPQGVEDFLIASVIFYMMASTNFLRLLGRLLRAVGVANLGGLLRVVV